MGTDEVKKGNAVGGLRNNAEDHPKVNSIGLDAPRSLEDMKKVFHELEVHQIELEMQNAELIKSRAETEIALAKYTDIYEYSPVCYLSLHLAGTITAINLSGATMLGVERSQLLGRKFGTFIKKEFHPTFEAFLGKVWSGLTQEKCEVALRKDLGTLFVQVGAMPAMSTEECRIVLFDITERKQAEEALQASEHRLKMLYDSGIVGMFYWTISGEIIDANDRFLNMVGCSHDDVAAGMLKWTEMTPREYSQLDQLALEELKSTGMAAPFEKEYIRKDESRLPIIIGLATVNKDRTEGVALVVDITVRKQAECKLKKSEMDQRQQREYLECVIANAGSCISIVTGQELRFSLVNSAFQAFVPDVPMVGRTYREVFPEAAEMGAEALVQRVLETGDPWKVESYRAPIPGKPEATWQGLIVRLPARLGEEPSALTVVWDITEIKRTEARVTNYAERLLE